MRAACRSCRCRVSRSYRDAFRAACGFHRSRLRILQIIQQGLGIDLRPDRRRELLGSDPDALARQLFGDAARIRDLGAGTVASAIDGERVARFSFEHCPYVIMNHRAKVDLGSDR